MSSGAIKVASLATPSSASNSRTSWPSICSVTRTTGASVWIGNSRYRLLSVFVKLVSSAAEVVQLQSSAIDNASIRQIICCPCEACMRKCSGSERSHSIDFCAANELWEGSLTPIIGVGDASHRTIQCETSIKHLPELRSGASAVADADAERRNGLFKAIHDVRGTKDRAVGLVEVGRVHLSRGGVAVAKVEQRESNASRHGRLADAASGTWTTRAIGDRCRNVRRFLCPTAVNQFVEIRIR